jgi:hypothetical protein
MARASARKLEDAAAKAVNSEDIASKANAKYQYLKGKYHKRDEEFLRLDQLYEGDHDAAFGWKVPGAEDKDDVRVDLEIPVKLVKHVRGLYTANDLGFMASVPDTEEPTVDELNLGSRLEEFAKALLLTNNARFGPVWERGVTFGLQRGWGAWFAGWDQIFEDDPKGNVGCPIVLKAVDPGCLYLEPGGIKERFASAIYATWRDTSEIKDQWGVDIEGAGIEDGPGKPDKTDEEPDPHDTTTGQVLYLDYWFWKRTEEFGWSIWQAIVAGSTVIKPATRMPAYTCLPYRVWLVQPDPFGKPEAYGKGLLAYIIKTLRVLEQVLNRKIRRFTYAADNVYVAEAKDRVNADPWLPMTMDKRPGAVNGIPRGWALRPLIDVTPNQDADSLIQLFMALLEQVGLPSLGYGALPGGDTQMSGLVLKGVTDAAATWLAPDTASLAQEWRIILQLIFSLCSFYLKGGRVLSISRLTVDDSGKPTRKNLGLKQSDFAKQELDIVIDTLTPQDRFKMGQFGLQMKNLPLIERPEDERSIQEKYFFIKNPDKVNRAKLRDLIMRRPEVQDALALRAALAMKLPIDIAKLLAPPAPVAPPPGIPGGFPSGGAQGAGGPPQSHAFGNARPAGGERQVLPGPGPGQVQRQDIGPRNGPPPQQMGNAPGPSAMTPGLPADLGQLPPEIVAQMIELAQKEGFGNAQ